MALDKYLCWLRELSPEKLYHALKNRFVRGPIETVGEMAEFVQTRAAYVAQTSLFGYLKERMGTSYPRYFADDVFVVSIRQAQMRVYRACAADLAIFTTAVTFAGAGLGNDDAARLAKHCFEHAMKNSGAEPPEDLEPEIEAFQERAARTLWPQAAIMENAFTQSPAELIEAAPIIDDYKKLDSEIVVNSIRFRWRDIREQFRKRVQSTAISEDFLLHHKPNSINASDPIT